MTVLDQILQHKIVAIIRGAGSADVLDISKALYDGGVRLVEVTLNSPNAIRSIEILSAALGDKMLIGAGTVLDASAAKTAVGAGARFIISPTLDPDTIRQTKDLGAVSMPGAFTPTEIYQAYIAGGDIIKVFPGILGVEYIKSIRAPLPQIPMMPTGGVSAENIRSFLDAGAVAFGIGTALVNPQKALTEAYLAEISANARKFVESIS